MKNILLIVILSLGLFSCDNNQWPTDRNYIITEKKFNTDTRIEHALYVYRLECPDLGLYDWDIYTDSNWAVGDTFGMTNLSIRK